MQNIAAHSRGRQAPILSNLSQRRLPRNMLNMLTISILNHSIQLGDIPSCGIHRRNSGRNKRRRKRFTRGQNSAATERPSSRGGTSPVRGSAFQRQLRAPYVVTPQHAGNHPLARSSAPCRPKPGLQSQPDRLTCGHQTKTPFSSFALQFIRESPMLLPCRPPLPAIFRLPNPTLANRESQLLIANHPLPRHAPHPPRR